MAPKLRAVGIKVNEFFAAARVAQPAQNIPAKIKAPFVNKKRKRKREREKK